MHGKNQEFTIEQCSKDDFAEVIHFIEQMRLDNNELNYNQFLIAKKHDKLVGFGRIRDYVSCMELCSLGVVEPYRNRGAGTILANELIKKSGKPLFVVTVIPNFFKRLGFKETNEFPSEIKAKINYCSGSLPVEESYCAMKLNKPNFC